LKRKEFLSRVAAGGVLAALAPGDLLARMTRDEGLFIGHLTPAGAPLGGLGAAAARGAQLGTAEAAGAATRLRRQVRLLESTATGAAESLAAAARLVERGATVLLGGFGRETAVALDQLAAEQGVLFLNVGDGGDELREVCRPTTFHVVASSAMRRDALDRWVQEGGDRDAGASIVGWSGSLERHGAAQLNDRYRVRFNESMSSASWAGWMAVKIAWEAYAHTRGGDAATMAQFLASDRASFDGHKGIGLSFRPWNHQLRQPLYVARHAAEGEIDIVAEIPRPAAAATGEATARLDFIGGEPGPRRCIDGS
jgi:ABC-type branched-subunit amino acid transport system substrate-binding protein